MLKKTLYHTMLCLLTGSTIQATATRNSLSKGAMMSDMYKVEVAGNKVDVYAARVQDPPFKRKVGGPYAFANLTAKGPLKVKISSKKVLRNAVIRPARPNVKMKVVDDHTLVLNLPGPVKFSLEPDGKNGPLLLFVNPPEKNTPEPGDKNVVYFGPGIHNVGKINLTDNQTLYLAPGAVVKGGVAAKGNNIAIRGRGILDGSDYPWRKGPTQHTIMIQGTNITVEGITIRGSAHWTIVPRHSRNVTVRNVKICGGRVQNDDGINPCNSQDVLIKDCFIRSDDDCVAMKGFNFKGDNSDVERITVEDCILWCDRARIFLLGHESRAKFMRDIKLRNLDIIHFNMTAFLLEPGEDMRLENVLVENVRLHGKGNKSFIRLRPLVNRYMRNKVPGHIKNITFRNIQVDGKPGKYLIEVKAPDAKHRVEKVLFDGVSILGKPISASSSYGRIGDYTEDIEFVTSTATGNTSK